jgi:hypothetical protein
LNPVLPGSILLLALLVLCCWIFNALAHLTSAKEVVTMKARLMSTVAWATATTLAGLAGNLAVSG